MNIQQITKTNTQIEEFKKINLEELFALSYPNQTDLANIPISRMNIGEFNTLSKRIVLQLEKEINSENGLILPFNFTTPEFGQSTIDAMLGAFISQVKARQFPSAENSLMWLSHYQLQNGFFDKSKIKTHSVEIVALNKAKDDLKLITENYLQLKNQYDTLLKELTSQKKQISDFQIQKQSELQQITNNLATANTNNTQIQNLFNSSTQSQTKVNAILDQVEKDKKSIENTSKTIASTYSDFQTKYLDLLKQLRTTEENYQKIYVDFDEKLKFVESKQAYFTDRNNYLDNLIGREVGASLFETFKQRKLELKEPLKWWRIAVGVMAVLTFVVILSIFTNFFGLFGEINTALKWENILVNALKSLPFFFLLYYAIAQYNKERNFQEEYAFKSAAALTIKAYADILKEDKNKDELILKAVYGIYRSPIYTKLKSTKEVNSALDMVNDLVGKGVDIIKKK
jgi:hypothetical protein